jgi:hypothetical protein
MAYFGHAIFKDVCGEGGGLLPGGDTRERKKTRYKKKQTER